MIKLKIVKTRFHGVFKINGKFATINLVPGHKSSNEELVAVKDTEYRIWDSYSSKPSAALRNGIKIFPLESGMNILYLGLAQAKTASFFSDIIDRTGLIFGIEISERAIRDAIPICELRGNIIPILNSARRPELYEDKILSKVDLVYEDVASNDQVQILIRNCDKFLKAKGFAIIAIKSQSIDVTRPPRDVYKECLEELEKHFEILDKVELDPYEKHHLFVVMKSKK